MKKFFLSGVCVASLFSVQSHGTCSCLPISKTTAGIGAGATGLSVGAMAYLIAKNGFDVAFSSSGRNKYFSLFSYVRIPVPALSKTASAVTAAVVALPATWIGWKVCERFTADGYYERARKILFPQEHERSLHGRKSDETKLLEAIVSAADASISLQETIEKVKELFAMQRNPLAKTGNALEEMHEKLLEAQDYLYCSRRGFALNDELHSVQTMIDYASRLSEVILDVTRTIKEDPEYQQQYDNELRERSLVVEQAKVKAMNQPKHVIIHG